MRIRWTIPAAGDLERINDYLREHYPHFARTTMRRIYQSVRSLRTSPSRGRQGRRSGARELVLAPLPYIIVYRIKEQAIEILHIYHGSQNWK